MREIEPQQARARLGRIAHEVVMVHPNNGDEQIADRIAEPARPECQQRLEGRMLRRPQLQNQYRNEDGEDAVRKCVETLWRRLTEHRHSNALSSRTLELCSRGEMASPIPGDAPS